MQRPTTFQAENDTDATGRSRDRAAPGLGRFTHLGLQGKLVGCFVATLGVALGASCWLFIWQSNARLADIMGEQARQMAYALSLASKPAMEAGEIDELGRIGGDLIKSRNILYVAFLDADGEPVSLSSRDPDAEWDQRSAQGPDQGASLLMKVQHRHSPIFGEYLGVTAPVLRLSSPAAADLVGTRRADPSQLLGYVVLGISPVREQAQMRHVNYTAVAVGVMVMVVSLPIMILLIRRIFQPIRQLVRAANRIAGGDLDTEVAVHRPDVIGTLARSFNEMARQVKSQQRNLEQEVRQRTAQLAAANQRLSIEIAEKEDFLRAVSHDLNAPLRNISGMASMLLRKHRAALEELDGDAIHRVERIQKNVEVEMELIAELLELSRIKTRPQRLGRVELTSLVDELAEIFENDLRQHGIDLIVDTPLPVLHCDRVRIRQVFQNLIDNAIKFIPHDDSDTRHAIHVGCEIRDSEAEFYVRDTGRGIHPDDLTRIFNIFRTGGNATANAGKGIGLATVKSIVETYAGSIHAVSEPGRGATFRFTINGQYIAEANRDSDGPGSSDFENAGAAGTAESAAHAASF